MASYHVPGYGPRFLVAEAKTWAGVKLPNEDHWRQCVRRFPASGVAPPVTPWDSATPLASLCCCDPLRAPACRLEACVSSGLATDFAARRCGPEGCPQQAGGSGDCGLFVLMGALHTVHDRPIPYGKPAVWQRLMSSFRRHVAYRFLSAKPELADRRHFE